MFNKLFLSFLGLLHAFIHAAAMQQVKKKDAKYELHQ